MEKYHKTDIAPVEQENERDETYRAVNPQIDCARTGGNYHIVMRQWSYTQFFNDKIEALDLPTNVRKDAVLMCSFVVGSDSAFFKNLSPQEQKDFFVECTRFFAERYSEGNIISAVVHMDETTPHLHLNLIPIADGRLCAKTLFDRKELQSLQTNLYEAVGMKWNLQRGKEGSQAKHLSTAEYKTKKIVEQARGEASGILAEADQKAERKVQIARLHADGIVSQAERTEIYLDYRPQAMPPFFDQLRAVMAEKGATRYALVKALPIYDSYFTNWKHGKSPNLLTLILLADYLDVTVDHLVGRDR